MKWKAGVCLILLAATARAGFDSPPPTADSLLAPDSTLVRDTSPPPRPPDTILFVPEADSHRQGRVTDSTNYEKRLIQQPTVALFKSMVAPGWGQLGNRRYIKAAIFAGFQTWFVYSAFDYGSQASDARDRWSAATDTAERNRLYDIYEDKRGQRNKFTWFAVICSFFSMFDAYVDAHLSGSPEHRSDDRVSFDVVPSGTDGAQATVSLSF
ncbi:MAG: DUF5683 domain-containing protein [candidate division Zixibacteria bacterium]|jgi:hypothetical protein|nr:DUF5683 domain-containing protein [candidate division Zixibacteria bacterium]